MLLQTNIFAWFVFERACIDRYRRVTLVLVTVGALLCSGAFEVASVLRSDGLRSDEQRGANGAGGRAVHSRLRIRLTTVLEDSQNLNKAANELRDVMKDQEKALAEKTRDIKEEVSHTDITADIFCAMYLMGIQDITPLSLGVLHCALMHWPRAFCSKTDIA